MRKKKFLRPASPWFLKICFWTLLQSEILQRFLSLSFRLLNWDIQRHTKPGATSLLGESWERLSPRKSLYLRGKQIVKKRQQTRLLVEDSNFREMFQYYFISGEFHNYLPIVLNVSVIISYLLYNFYLKLTNALRHTFSLMEILFQLLNENFVCTLWLFSAIYSPK